MNREISVNLADLTGWNKEFNGSRDLLSFLEYEFTYWEEQWNSLGDNGKQQHHYIGCHSHIGNVINDIRLWNEDSGKEDSVFQQQAQGIVSHIRSVWLWSGHPYTEAFILCNRQHGEEAADAFLNFVISASVNNLQDSNRFFGVLAGYEFLNQESDILKRRKTEKASLDRLRGQLEKTTSTLINEVEDFKKEFNSWEEETQQKWSDLLDKSSKDHSSQLSEQTNESTSFMADSKSKMKEMESTYQEKLRLEKPAEYWRKSAKQFEKEGCVWTVLLIIILASGVIYFLNSFADWAQGQTLPMQLDTIQGVVIFGSALAVYAFLVRVLSRLLFSAFHLKRDAEEREQLTYLYLSLVNEKEIGEKSRDIVLQALFCRSETGLLAGESAPTMPGLGMNEIINSKK